MKDYSNVNIVFSRIDNRLVHGQVGMVWANQSGANLLLVVDDAAAKDKLQQNLMKMTVAATSIGIRFWTVEQTIENIWKAAPSQKIFIVTKTPNEMRRLVEAGVPINLVNVGNMHTAPGKRLYKGDYIYVDDQDEDDLMYMVERGIKVEIQVLPDYKKIVLNE